MTTVQDILDGKDITKIDEKELTYIVAEHAGDLDHKEFGKALNMLTTHPQKLIAVKKRCAVKGEGSTACEAYRRDIDNLEERYYAYGDSEAGKILDLVGELDEDNNGGGTQEDTQEQSPWET